jgi:DNA-binding NarL/FixJ family response regulator
MDYLKELDDIRREIAIARNMMRDCERRVNGIYKDLHAVRGAEDILTKTEFKVFELVKKGLSNTNIAAILYVATATVEAHVYSILGKLDCKNRTELLQID